MRSFKVHFLVVNINKLHIIKLVYTHKGRGAEVKYEALSSQPIENEHDKTYNIVYHHVATSLKIDMGIGNPSKKIITKKAENIQPFIPILFINLQVFPYRSSLRHFYYTRLPWLMQIFFFLYML